MKLGSSCVPGEGIHGHGPFGFAVFDAILTILASWIISNIFGWSFVITLLVLFAIGILTHRLLGVNTALNVRLFGLV